MDLEPKTSLELVQMWQKLDYPKSFREFRFEYEEKRRQAVMDKFGGLSHKTYDYKLWSKCPACVNGIPNPKYHPNNVV